MVGFMCQVFVAIGIYKRIKTLYKIRIKLPQGREEKTENDDDDAMSRKSFTGVFANSMIEDLFVSQFYLG